MSAVSGNSVIASKPENVLTVQPTNIAVFYATRWLGDPDDPEIAWMAETFGWKIKGVGKLVLKSSTIAALVVASKSGHPYKIGHGSWAIALGSSGSLRVVTDRQFKTDYKEIAR